jgi:hypothetical protein
MIHTWLYVVLLFGQSDWGFFGHRLINRVAVYTVPTEMLGWYKPYIDYITDHAVDPDKRRYATKHEAVRHYIDLDHWGETTFDHVPRYWDKVLALNIEVFTVNDEDTIQLLEPIAYAMWSDSIADYSSRLKLVRNHYLRQYYEDKATIPCDSLQMLFPDLNCRKDATVYMRDVFSAHGIVPYHLQAMQRRLTTAFRNNDLDKVLRNSAEIGHYIADACVPLHTTSNYNGQLTDQVGIHAFWESRIPELFALEEFDMVVGTAQYMSDPTNYFWNLVLGSHQEVDKVLQIEKTLSQTYPSDQQYCFEDRLNKNIRTQCSGYAKAYDLAMDKMVEERFRIAVKAVGDAWYTAWVDAGQPEAPSIKLVSQRTTDDEELDNAVKTGKTLGREHDN